MGVSTRVYLSGPMNGLPDLNRASFLAAEAQLAALGYIVYNPALLDRPGWDYDAYLDFDLKAIRYWAQLVVRLPGWEASPGALAEISLAEQEHIPVLDLCRLHAGGGRSGIISRIENGDESEEGGAA